MFSRLDSGKIHYVSDLLDVFKTPSVVTEYYRMMHKSSTKLPEFYNSQGNILTSYLENTLKGMADFSI